MEDMIAKEVKFKITGGLIIFSVLIAINILYFLKPDLRKEVVFLASTVAGAAGIFSAYYAGIQLRINTSRSRMESAFDFARKYIEFDTVQVSVKIDQMIKDNIEPSEIYRKINDDEILRSQIKHILVFFEVSSVAIQMNFIEEKVLHQTLYVSTINYFERFRPYIMGLREESKTEEYFIEYEKLFTSWKRGKSLLDDKDLPKLL